ncbi:MAG: hypothetical protein V4631_12640 [Pseudomonadota bacterium]
MTQQINLFNPIFRKQKKYFSSVTMLQALAIICVACALLAADAARRSRALQAQAAATDSLLAARQLKLSEARVRFAPRQKSAALAAEITAAQAELAMLANAASMIERGDFGDRRGFSDYFRAFARQRIDGLWLTGVDIGSNGSRLGVRGNTLRAELVPQYMRRLSSEPVMQGKAFSSLDIGVAPALPAAVGAPAADYLKFSLQSTGGK